MTREDYKKLRKGDYLKFSNKGECSSKEIKKNTFIAKVVDIQEILSKRNAEEVLIYYKFIFPHREEEHVFCMTHGATMSKEVIYLGKLEDNEFFKLLYT